MTGQLSIFARARQAAQPGDPFEDFWNAFDDKRDKGYARRAWRLAVKKADTSEIIAAAARYAKRRNIEMPKGTEKEQFWPMAGRWLNGERWLEERTAEEKQQHSEASAARALEQIAWMVKRGIHTTSMTDQKVRAAYAAGHLTEEECRNYGVKV